MKAILALEDGSVFHGQGFGASTGPGGRKIGVSGFYRVGLVSRLHFVP